jgi:hypothetical protein
MPIRWLIRPSTARLPLVDGGACGDAADLQNGKHPGDGVLGPLDHLAGYDDTDGLAG